MNTLLNRLLFTTLMFVIACNPLDKGDLTITGLGGQQQSGGGGGPAPVSLSDVQVTELRVFQDTLQIRGVNLQKVTKVEVEITPGNKSEFQITSQNGGEIFAKTTAAVAFLMNTSMNLIFSNAQAQASFPITFNLNPNSVLNQHIADGAISPDKLGSFGAQDNNILRYNAASGTWQPQSLNALSYKGTWDADANSSPFLASGGIFDPGTGQVTAETGWYWVVNNAGTTLVDGINSWNVGDWIIYNGSSFEKLGNSSNVMDFNGRTGSVLPIEGDYSLDLLSDVDTSTVAPNPGELLNFDGTNWVPLDPAGLTVGAVSSTVNNTIIADSDSNNTGDIELRTGTTTKLIVKNNGAVGVGLVNPDKGFEVFAPTADITAVFSSGDTGGYISFEDNSTSSDSAVGVGAIGDDLKFRSGDNDQMTLKNNGFLGIGVDPNYPLHVFNDSTDVLAQLERPSSNGVKIQFKNSDQVWEVGQTSAEEFVIADVDNSNAHVMTIEPGAPANSLYVDSTGNIGLGRANPASALDVDGVIRANQICDENGTNCKVISSGWVNGGGTFLAADGTVGAPSFSFTSDTDTGLYRPAADEMALSIAGSEQIRLTATGLGIGDTTPDAELDVVGDIHANQICDEGGLKCKDLSQGWEDIVFLSNFGSAANPGLSFFGDTDTGIFRSAADVLAFSTGGTEQMNIISNGNVGIGRAVPASKLDVNGVIRATDICDEGGSNCVDISLGWQTGYQQGDTFLAGFGSAAAPSFSFNGDTNTGFYRAGNDMIGFAVVGAERATFNNTRFSTNVNRGWRLQHAGTSASSPTYTFHNDFNTGMYAPSTDHLAFSTLGTQRMIIDSAGRIGMGKNPHASSKLDVNGKLHVPEICDENGNNCKDVTQDWSATGYVAGDTILSAAGTATNPGHSFLGDQDTGLYSTGSDSLSLSAGGTEQVRVTATGMSIKTGAAPNAALDVSGVIRADQICDSLGGNCKIINTGWGGGGSLNNGDIFKAADGTAAAPSFTFNSDDDTGLYRTMEDKIGISIGGTAKFLFDNISFASNSLTGPFMRINGTSPSTPAYSFQGDADTGIYSNTADILSFSTGGTEQMRLNSTGLKIGNASNPASELDVAGTIRAEQICDEGGVECLDVSGGFGYKAGDIIKAGNGTTANPGLGFNSSPNSGFSMGSSWINLSVVGWHSYTFTSQYLRGRATGGFQMQTGSSSATTPTYGFYSDTDSGLFRAGTNIIGLSTGGTERLRASASGISIGTGANANSALDVSGVIRADQICDATGHNCKVINTGWGGGGGLNNGDIIKAADGTAGAPGLTFNNDDDTGLYRTAGGNVVFTAGGSSSFMFNPIVLSSVSNGGPQLMKTGNNPSQAAYSFVGNQDTGMYQPVGDNLGFSTAGGERIRITSAGDVGIGTSAPNSKLDVAGTIRAQQICAENGSNCVDISLGWPGGGGYGDGDVLKAADGSPVAPGITFNNDSDTGFYRTASNQFVYTAGTATMFAFDMVGIRSATATGGVMRAVGNAATAPAFAFATDENTGMFTPGNDKIGFTTGANERVRITNTGMSIGTNADANAALDVSGIIRADQICDESGDNCKDISLGWSGSGASAINDLTDATTGGGSQNLGLGPNALLSITGSANSNVGVGHVALGSLSSGDGNIGMGYGTMVALASGNNNTAIGHQSMFQHTAGDSNTAIGAMSKFSTAGGSESVHVGFGAGQNSSSSYSINIGYRAGAGTFSVSTGDHNSFVGYQAGADIRAGSHNSAFGTTALKENETGSYNTAVGAAALNNNRTGSYNTAIGYSAGQGVPGPVSGNYNTFVGYRAGYAAQNASNNVLIGKNAGKNMTSTDDNIMIGPSAGATVTTGGGNILIGPSVTNPGGPTANFRMNIGNTIYGDLSNARVGINVVTPNDALDVTGDIDATGCIQTNDSNTLGGTCVSDRRLKDQILPLEGSLEGILKLNPVTYVWKEEFFDVHQKSGEEIGLIAQEVKEVFPEMVKTGEDGFDRINYGVWLQLHIIKAFKQFFALFQETNQEVNREIASLKKKNQKLEAENAAMKERLEKIERKLGL